MARPDHYQKRAAVNDQSRNTAEQHAQPWSSADLDMLLGLWDGTEETLRDLAEILGRTVEACRQRYYTARTGQGVTMRTRTSTTTTTTTTETVRRVGWDDEGYEADWYVQ